MKFDPATEIQNYLVFGEFGDVNPSICDSSTFTFLSVAKMEEVFEHEIEGCFLYSRHWNPTNKYLSPALARMEDGRVGARDVFGNGGHQLHPSAVVLRGRRNSVGPYHLRWHLRVAG